MEPTDRSPRAAHYFDNDPTVPSEPRTVDVTLPDLSLRLSSDRGVFSADRLDAGTKLLLMEAPPISEADQLVLDIGCGWGPITCVSAARAPRAVVWAVDVNERARLLTEANAAALGLTARVHVCAPDDVPADLLFDRILSNPPIRVGKVALHTLLTHWLSALAPSGVAHLVVHKHLGSDSLAKWLRQRGHRVDRISSRAGYRLLEVTAPTGGKPT